MWSGEWQQENREGGDRKVNTAELANTRDAVVNAVADCQYAANHSRRQSMQSGLQCGSSFVAIFPSSCAMPAIMVTGCILVVLPSSFSRQWWYRLDGPSISRSLRSRIPELRTRSSSHYSLTSKMRRWLTTRTTTAN